jgi:flagellar FliJ protein
MENRLLELKKLRKKLEMELEKQKKIVFNALNDVKIMEKLKEKHINNYIMYLNKEEMKMLDELVVTRFKNE